MRAALVPAVALMVLVSCSATPGMPESEMSYYIGTPHPTGAVALHLASDGTPEPTPTPTPTPTPSPELEKPPEVVQPVRTAAPQPRGGQYDLEELVCSYSWSCETALRVMYCESGGQNVQNYGGGPYVGPFQVGLFHFRAGEDPWHVPTNVAVAYRVYLSSGWGAWSCY